MCNYGFGGFGWTGMLAGGIISLVVFMGLVLLVVWVVNKMGATATQPSHVPSGTHIAKDIAQTRYAKGDISRDEYQQILSDLDR